MSVANTTGGKMKRIRWLVFAAILVFTANVSLARRMDTCNEKRTATYSARKVVDYCLQAWTEFSEPTDPEPDSCQAKLTAYENSVKELRVCLKKLND